MARGARSPTPAVWPLSPSGRPYYQWMARGRALVEDLLPLLDPAEIADARRPRAARLAAMCERYAPVIERERQRLSRAAGAGPEPTPVGGRSARGARSSAYGLDAAAARRLQRCWPRRRRSRGPDARPDRRSDRPMTTWPTRWSRSNCRRFARRRRSPISAPAPGFPGLPLAIALPQARVGLVESNGRKCEFIARTPATCGLANVAVVDARAEEWRGGLRATVTWSRRAPWRRCRWSPSTPRRCCASAGRCVAWRGRRDPARGGRRRGGRRARPRGCSTSALRCSPYPAAPHRHLHVDRQGRRRHRRASRAARAWPASARWADHGV